MSKFAIFVVEERHPALSQDIFLVSLERVREMQQICERIFGRKNVDIWLQMKVDEFPENINEAIRTFREGGQVDERFRTLEWIKSKREDGDA